MKKFLYVVFVSLVSVLVSTSCSRDKSYADYVHDENELIDKYIKRHKIKVVSTRPENIQGEWLDENGDTIYYKTPSGLLYHQISLGDTTAPETKVSSRAYVRYDGYNLWDDLVYSTSEKYSASPQSFLIQNKPASTSTYGAGFQEAVRYLRKGGKCSAIISFKIGNGENSTITNKILSDKDQYTPMMYEIRLVNVE